MKKQLLASEVFFSRIGSKKMRSKDSTFLEFGGIFQQQNKNVPSNDRRPQRTREPFAFCSQPGQDDQQSQSALQTQVELLLGIKLT